MLGAPLFFPLDEQTKGGVVVGTTRRTTPGPWKTGVVGSGKRRKIHFDEVDNRGDGGGGQ